VSAKEVSVAMRQVKAVVYHLHNREYRLASRAHKTALEFFTPLSIQDATLQRRGSIKGQLLSNDERESPKGSPKGRSN
jgi:hypothetical protein